MANDARPEADSLMGNATRPGATHRVNLSRLTVARKMSLIAVLAVTVCFASIVAISVQGTRKNLIQLREDSFLTITQLLATNVAGGLRWKKAEAVEEAYSAFVTAEGSAIASIRTFDRDGGVVTAFDSKILRIHELSDAVKLSTDAGSDDGVYTLRTADHVVVVVPAGGKTPSDRSGTLAVAWSLDALNEHVRAAMRDQIWVSVAGLVGLIALLLFTSTRMLGRPLAEMTGAMAKLAAGDNNVEIPATTKRDDIGSMARIVQVFKENAIEMVRMRAEQADEQERQREEKRRVMLQLADNFETSVKKVVETVSAAASQMQTAAQSMLTTAEKTSDQAAAVDQASQEATNNVHSVASATEELTASIGEIGTQVNHSAEIASSAAEQASSTNKQIEGLVSDSQRIGEVIELINKVAEQTNLLALNATIEAARAGDAGKGFAVVANEVKNLAMQTAKATDEITQQISSIQNATGGAATAIKEISRTIEEMNHIASAVAAAVEQQGSATQEISRNVQEASEGTQRVSQSIGSMTKGAQETGQSAHDVLDAAGALAQQSDILRGEVDTFIQMIRAA